MIIRPSFPRPSLSFGLHDTIGLYNNCYRQTDRQTDRDRDRQSAGYYTCFLLLGQLVVCLEVIQAQANLFTDAHQHLYLLITNLHSTLNSKCIQSIGHCEVFYALSVWFNVRRLTSEIRHW